MDGRAIRHTVDAHELVRIPGASEAVSLSHNSVPSG
jgi:hypothetical protein